MFKYTLPCGGFRTITTMTDTGIKFDPPVYEQRYCFIIQMLEDPRWVNKIKKVAEFGCAGMQLFQLMRRIETIEHILQVDIDDATLKTYLKRTEPLTSDFIRQRQSPLRVEVLHGSVADSSEELQNTDAVVAVELIEHVYDDVLVKIPLNVFGYMQPKIAVFTTPNSDYNTMFMRFKPLFPNGFRHLDHKFEWTRAEFRSWCRDVIEKYPNYMFSIKGVGDPPKGHETVGYVSQIALFVRLDMLDKPLVEPINHKPASDCITPYKRLHVVEFPFHVDTRTIEEKIWVEVQYELNRCTRNEDNYDDDKFVYKMSIAELLGRLKYMGATAEMLDTLLKQHKKQIQDGFIIMEEENDSNSSDDMFKEVENFDDDEQENWDV